MKKGRAFWTHYNYFLNDQKFLDDTKQISRETIREHLLNNSEKGKINDDNLSQQEIFICPILLLKLKLSKVTAQMFTKMICINIKCKAIISNIADKKGVFLFEGVEIQSTFKNLKNSQGQMFSRTSWVRRYGHFRVTIYFLFASFYNLFVENSPNIRNYLYTYSHSRKFSFMLF